jgi:hypothetical protein
MSFPKKFKKRLMLERHQLELVPETAVITYAVCGTEKKSCGYEGWIIEALYKGKGAKIIQAPIDDSQKCPHCRLQMFRTGIQYFFKRGRPALPPKGIRYSPIKWV